MRAGTISFLYRSRSRGMSGLVQLPAAAPADADAATVLEPLRPDARRLVAARAERLHVREMERRLLLDDAARRVPARLHVALHQVHALDHHAVGLAEDAEHLAGLPALAARDH